MLLHLFSGVSKVGTHLYPAHGRGVVIRPLSSANNLTHFQKTDDPMTPKVTPRGHIKWPDLKLRFSKFDIVPKAHQWSELFETHSV